MILKWYSSLSENLIGLVENLVQPQWESNTELYYTLERVLNLFLLDHSVREWADVIRSSRLRGNLLTAK